MKSLIEVLVDVLFRIFRGSVHGRVLGLLSFIFVLSGCLGGGSGGSEAASAPGGSGPGGSTPVAQEVSQKSGRDFDCVMLNLSDRGQIWCRSLGAPDARLMIPNDGEFHLYVETSSEIEAFETWDDTMCFSTQVQTRPQSRLSGLATYCFGDASLGFNYMAYPIIYSGPVYDDATHGSPDLWYLTEPFSGGDHNMDVMTDTGGVWLVMMDSSIEVVESDLDCVLDDTTLSCDDFNLEVQ